ncbi:flagellar motor protein MotB [Actinomyces oris]|uniref:OmpA family protein n=2 Tax=Actinomyces oris TaxID=544580 RepID=UPI00094D4907|nr:OmpA family protein [Actinomyces oris]OLO56767.1 flagellar motor protein MotB [Actinomyces oris]OLO62103.1 flagellar motor protein MotB [Actinomyces oris]
MRRRVFLTGSILTGVGLPLLAGCKAPWQSKGQAGSTTAASASAGKASGTAVPAASGAPQGWQELDAHVMGHHLGFQVSPLVRRDEKTTVLVLKLTRAKDDPAVKDIADAPGDGSNTFEASLPLSRSGLLRRSDWGANGVRLLDLSTNRVWLATASVENKVKDNYNNLPLKPGASTSCFVLFGPVDAKEVTVFVPQAGFVTVNVLDSSAAAASGIDFKAIDKAFDSVANPDYEAKPDQALAAPVPIERYTRALDDSTSTHTGGKDITVTLASDVTFASDSADLASGAEAQLQTVAGQLAQYPDGGTLSIVGHTDDVQDDAYNQTLSEKRANAVKTRLEQLTKLDKWQTSVSGKGESEPKVNDTSDEARAVNRRVEITLTPTGGTTTKTTTPSAGTGSLPENKGPVAKGSEGVTVKHVSGNSQLTITIDHVTRSGGYLLGQLHTTLSVKKGSAPNGLEDWLSDKEALFSNSRSEAGSRDAVTYAATGLTLLAGGERIYPADYRDAGFKTHVPLTELQLTPPIKAGTTTVCVIWPDPGGDTVTLDHAATGKEVADLGYRLTDIPVKNS